MTILSFILLTLMGSAMLLLAFSFALLVKRNIQQGTLVREQLAKRVESLRMSKMLKALGLDFQGYLYRVPLSKINSSMKNCENCATTDQCDDMLQQPQIDPAQIDFCPNQACLTQFTQLEKSKA